MKVLQTEFLTPETLTSETEKLWVYNGLDCCLTHEIYGTLASQIDATAARTYRMSLALQAPILEMNMRGVRVDLAKRDALVAELGREAAALQAFFDKLCLGVFERTVNPNSPTQVKALLYDWLHLPVQKSRNTKGEYVATADREALEKLAGMYPTAKLLVAFILAMRDKLKLAATLNTSLSDDGRFRTNFSIAGTNTGRLASSMSDFSDGSNAQNLDRRIRNIFIADPGMKLANIDLEQADARNVGLMCWLLFGDASFLDACESGDLHTTVARMCWTELPWTDDPKANRAIADQPAYRENSYRDLAKKLGHGCLTADHEVLTPLGWVPIDSSPEVILQWEPGTTRAGTSRFVNVSHWEAHRYGGNLQCFESLAISAQMTHDHRVPFKRDPASRNVHEQPAEAGPGKFMPLGGGYVGGSETVPARLIAALMADGHQETNWMAFHFTKQRKIDRLKELCVLYDYAYRVHGDKIRVAGTLPKYPGAFMLNWDRESLEDFIDELKYWDGHIGATSVTISSTDLPALEWYQTVARLVGLGGNISKPYTSGFGSTVYRLQQNNRAYANGSTVTHTVVPADDVMVYCPTVPSSWFYVRRNGRIYVTGNTNFNGQPTTMAMHTKVERKFIESFQQRYFGAFPSVHRRIEWVAQKLLDDGYLTTVYGRRRHFFKRRNDNKTLNEACAFDPQSMTADAVNYGMLAAWHWGKAQLLLQVHDSILFQYPEELEDEIVPVLKTCMEVPLVVKGRRFVVPCEVQTGWSWGYPTYEKGTGRIIDNFNGMVKYRGTDNRQRV